MNHIAATAYDHDSPILVAPDRSTTYRASSIPSACGIADWCHPRSRQGRWMQDLVAGPVAKTANKSSSCLQCVG